MIPLAWRLLACALLTLPACSLSNGFDRAEMLAALQYRRALPDEPLTASGTEQAPVSLKPPVRLGLYFIPTQFPTRQSMRTVEWLSEDRDRLIRQLAPLRDDRTVSEIVLLPDTTMTTLDRQELRRACARHDIDVLAIVDGVGSVDRYNNLSSLLYLTVIGAYLVPGTVSDALFASEGTLWDARADRLLDRMGSEGQAKDTGSAVRLEDDGALKEAQLAAFDQLGARLIDALRRRTGRPPERALFRTGRSCRPRSGTDSFPFPDQTPDACSSDRTPPPDES